MNDVKSLSQSKWRCKYHIVFAPNSTRIMYQEACRDFRGRMLPGPYPYAGNDTAAFESVKFYGIFEE